MFTALLSRISNHCKRCSSKVQQLRQAGTRVDPEIFSSATWCSAQERVRGGLLCVWLTQSTTKLGVSRSDRPLAKILDPCVHGSVRVITLDRRAVVVACFGHTISALTLSARLLLQGTFTSTDISCEVFVTWLSPH